MVVIHKIPIALAGLASLATAIPTSKPASKFSVNQVSRPATKASNFAANYGRALSKYGATVPSHVQAAAALYLQASVGASCVRAAGGRRECRWASEDRQARLVLCR